MKEEMKEEKKEEIKEEIKKEEQAEVTEERKPQEQAEDAEERKPQEQAETAEDSEKESDDEAEEFEDEDDWEDEEREQEAVKPWKMALVFCGLILLAALICVVLWKFTHGASDDEQNPNQTVGQLSDRAEGQSSAGSVGQPSAEPEGQPSAGSAESPSNEPASAPENGNHVPDPSNDASAAPENTLSAPENTPTQEDKNRFVTKDGRTVIFTDCDDIVSPKEYVNLRTEPSTSQGNDTVSCRLNYGENAHRTGFSADAGWSRVEYDEKVLYVITSYVFVVEEQTAE